MISLSILKANIDNNFSNFEVNSIEKLGEGHRSVAVLVNGAWVFRFPKEQTGANDLTKEINFLPHVLKSVSISIPQFHYIGKLHNGFHFVGYPLISGILLDEEGVPKLREVERESLSLQIAQFINELSVIPIDLATMCGVPERNAYEHIRALYELYKFKIHPMLDLEVQQYISTRFDTYIESTEFKDYTPTVIHGDLSPDHFVIDSTTRKLSGIIDFGDMQINDPDYEYIYLLEDCGIDFTRQVMIHQQQENIETRLEKISLFVTFDQVQYILDGLTNGNKEWIEEGIEALKTEMQFPKYF